MTSRSFVWLNRLMRSKLFVPGSRPAIFEKAMLGAADIVSFDLEDAVLPEKKAEARNSVASFLRGRPATHNKIVVVRVNELGSEWFRSDIETVVGPGVNIINLPKVESREQILAAAGEISQMERAIGVEAETGLLANIETPKGLRLALEIATASHRVMGLQIGFADFSLSCGIDRGEKTALDAVRLGVCFAAAEAGIVAFDGAFLEVSNPDEFRNEAMHARRLGFVGKSCIHPTQVPIANEVFSPGIEEIARAESILAAASQKLEEGAGAFLHGGQMVDSPVISQAKAVVARAALLREISTK